MARVGHAGVTRVPIKQGGLAAQHAHAAAEAIAAHAGADIDPHAFHPVLRGVLLTGRGRQWIRRDLGDEGQEGESERHALWWPPTKVAGRYLAPYLASLEEAAYRDADRPAGELWSSPSRATVGDGGGFD